MIAPIKISLLILYCFTSWHTGRGEIILTEDKPYDVIDIKIPRKVWNQALNPTPLLKSPATIVVPVHVNDENEVENEELEDIIEESEIVSSTIVNDVIVQNLGNASTAIANVTETPIEDTPVTGQVSRFPCSCPDGQCGCCTGAFLDRFNMKACGNISFIPEDFVFDVRLSVNNNTVVRQRVSASDPPPICFNPRRAPFVRVCAEISNIRIRNRNAFACLDISADIGGFPIYEASFRCFGLGTSGVQTGLKPKPVSSGPKPVSLYGNGEDNDDRGSLIENIAGDILGGGENAGFSPLGGFLGGAGGGDSDNDDDGGPFDGIGDAVGDFFDGRKLH